MNIAIFGATGKTGLQLTQHALDAGHTVSVLARTPEKLTIKHDNLTVVQGDIYDQALVNQVVAGADGVICSLGSGSLGATTLRTDGTVNIINAMKTEAVRRLIVISAMGVGDSSGQLTFVSKLFVKLMLKNVMVDHANQEAVVKSSALDWTVLRPSGLIDGAATGNITFGAGTDTSIRSGRITRADVAAFALQELTENKHVGQAISLT